MTVKKPTTLNPHSAARNARCPFCRHDWTVQDDQDVATITIRCPKCDSASLFSDLHARWVEDASSALQNEAEKFDTQAEKIWSLIKEVPMFGNELEETFIVLGGLPIPVSSLDFYDLVTGRYFDEIGKVPGKESIEQVAALCRFHARKNIRNVGVRIVRIDGALFYDPLDDDGSVYRVTDSVQKVKLEMPVTVRWKGMLPARVESGQKKDVDAFLSLWKLDPETRILVLGFLCAAFIPDIAHTILLVLAEQGAGKSTFSSGIRRIIDPSAVERMRVPKESSLIEIAAKHQYAVSFDNVNQVLKPEICDTLSRLCTGGGSRTRSLYTNTDETILNLRRLLIINAINEPSYAMDLLDRILAVRLQPIGTGERISDEEMLEKLEALGPKIRGYILGLVPDACRLYPEVKAGLRGKLPRMADFAIWAEAFCRAAGEAAMLFFNSYVERQERAVEETLQDSTLFEALRELLPDENDEWIGNMTQLLNTLTEDVERKYPEKNMHRNLPANPQALSRRMGELKPALRQFGIGFEDMERKGHKREKIKRLFRFERSTSGSIYYPLHESEKIASASSAGLEKYINSTKETPADAIEKTIASATSSVLEKRSADDADAILTTTGGKSHNAQSGATDNHATKSHDENSVAEIQRFVLQHVRPSEHPTVREKNNIMWLIQAEFKTGPDRARTLIGMWLASGVLAEDAQDKWLLLPGPEAQEASA